MLNRSPIPNWRKTGKVGSKRWKLTVRSRSAKSNFHCRWIFDRLEIRKMRRRKFCFLVEKLLFPLDNRIEQWIFCKTNINCGYFYIWRAKRWITPSRICRTLFVEKKIWKFSFCRTFFSSSDSIEQRPSDRRALFFEQSRTSNGQSRTNLVTNDQSHGKLSKRFENFHRKITEEKIFLVRRNEIFTTEKKFRDDFLLQGKDAHSTETKIQFEFVERSRHLFGWKFSFFFRFPSENVRSFSFSGFRRADKRKTSTLRHGSNRRTRSLANGLLLVENRRKF